MIVTLASVDDDIRAGELVGANKEFLAKKWTTEEGPAQNTVTSIPQAADRYIWVGTFGGLARFDGVKFRVFDSTSARA